ncbi:MAG: ABC-F family ATP-binding cassette domain-containing protein [Planctomycetota bacterium]|jgi:ATP-binding cassette subfamily F protein 3
MILLDVEGVKRHFGPEPVLDGVTLQVRAGERVALVGPNGSGKTVLLRILAGKDDADAGSCRLHGSVHLGYLEQQPRFQSGRTLWDEAKGALARLIELQREALAVAEAISQTSEGAEHDRLAARYDHLQHELQRHDAYNLDHKIERVLQGLGFEQGAFAQEANRLSGGEQNRLMLAKLLLSEPNLMLLDEPSNHLDVQATEWLEDFLVECSAAMIVVSHDRCFLDKVVGRTLELFRGTLDGYAGSFSAYWRQKAERLLVQRRTYQKQQTEIAKAKEFIRRNAYGQKHAQAEDRRKKLERIKPVAPPRDITSPPMAFPKATRCGDVVLRAEHLAKAYDRPLFSALSFQIERGQRWAILGPNGCGKSTLLGCLLGLVQPDHGRVRLGQGVEIGYFDQQLAELDDDTAAVEAIRPSGKHFNEQQRRDLLARFGLTGQTVLQEVGSLSGGERCRSALARLAAADANFLVLDEPTNHLDLWALDALEQALKRFQGTALFVSHDRYFVNRVADHLLVFEADRVRVIEGNYETYQHLLGRRPPLRGGARAAEQPEKSGASGSGKRATRAGKSPGPPPAKRRFPYRKVADLEEEIFQRETALEELHGQLAQGDTHRDGNRVRQIKAEITRQKEALQTLYEHWEEATELNW